MICSINQQLNLTKTTFGFTENNDKIFLRLEIGTVRFTSSMGFMYQCSMVTIAREDAVFGNMSMRDIDRNCMTELF